VLTTAPAMALHQALLPIYRRTHDEARLGMVTLPGMLHGWTDDKTAADEVRRDVGAWFRRYWHAIVWLSGFAARSIAALRPWKLEATRSYGACDSNPLAKILFGTG